MNAPPAIRILLAEPLSLVRAGLHALIAGEAGLAITGETGNGEDLLKLVTRLRPEVLVLEPTLPGPPPAGLIREAMAIHPELKVMVLAGPQLLSAAIDLLEAGAAGCILKNDRPEEFLRGIHTVAAGELAVSGTVARSLLRRQAHPRPPSVDAITEREREILDLLAAGLSNKEIGQKLYLSVRTVEVHLRNVYSKLGVRSRLEAVTQTVRPSPEGPCTRLGWDYAASSD